MKSQRQAKIMEIISTTNVETQEQLLLQLQSAGFSSRLNTIFRECVTSFDYAQNIIVIHTLPGLANAAASALDAMNISVVLGTIAGDDTVFIVMRDNNSAAAFCGEIKSLLN